MRYCCACGQWIFNNAYHQCYIHSSYPIYYGYSTEALLPENQQIIGLLIEIRDSLKRMEEGE